ncbi:hypothetical protein [Paraburkholderia domus]|uniref:hypothetical protein n=1 Tax=Paraburkholderia domus TaxID=2793075 RepID=UPI001EF08AD9|nr:hypothetical protein [Paraburkholderia domus]
MHISNAEEERLAKLVLGNFERDGIATMTAAQRVAYLSSTTLSAYQLLRTAAGDEWVRGWLRAALDDLKSPAPFVFRNPS